MNQKSCNWIIVGALSGAISVLLGAAGSHWLQAVIESDYADTYSTAVRFHMLHSLALILGAIVLDRVAPNFFLSVALWLLLFGLAIFCGSLYFLSMTQFSILGAIAPVGGIFLILGWLSFAFGVLRSNAKRAS